MLLLGRNYVMVFVESLGRQRKTGESLDGNPDWATGLLKLRSQKKKKRRWLRLANQMIRVTWSSLGSRNDKFTAEMPSALICDREI